MDENQSLAEQFELNRGHLRGVAYRMLGSLGEADDAVQEAWLRLSRSRSSGIDNLSGWLTTVVARVCLDMLRSRKSRREQPLDAPIPEPIAKRQSASDPEQEALLADSVGLALLVVLDRLNPAERLAFVLHDLFGVSFDEIAGIVDRSPDATRQLASRARRRVQGTDSLSDADLSSHRELIDAFLSALRAGDLEALVELLDPDVVVEADQAAVLPGKPGQIRGAREWAKQAITAARGAQFARVALVNGDIGIVIAPRGRLLRVISFTIRDSKIAQLVVIADPGHLASLDIAIVE